MVRNLLAFGRLLRRMGLDVHPGRMLDAIEALSHLDVRVRDEVYHACRALLVHRHEDLPVFDRAFEAFWRPDRQPQPSVPDTQRAAPPDTGPNTRPDAEAASHGDTAAGAQREARPAAARSSADEESRSDAVGALRTWSDAAGLATKDFAAYTEEEMAVAHAALARLVWHPGTRRTRRWVRGHGPRLDLRCAVHGSLRTGGEILHLPRRRRVERQRPVVLLCDVSGSMERYARVLLQFAYAFGGRHRRLEAFLFSTRLTRITPHLRLRRIDAAVSAVTRAVPDWSGGTRIGDALRDLHLHWRARVLHGGPVVLIISDGWDRGDPLVLADQMARLRRNCHRVIWLNPLIGTDDYAPLTRGLRAALPFVDDFLAARTLLDLADLAAHLHALPTRSSR